MSFPRREKAVRRQTRKDPGHYQRRAGLSAFIFISLLAVFASPESRAQSQGPASKFDRIRPAASAPGPVHFNLNFLPWRKESATRQTVASALDHAMPDRVSAPTPSSSGYLPSAGPIPLRFASVRAWPERMTPASEAALSIALAPDPDLAIRRDQLVAQHEAGVAAMPTVMPEGSSTITITASSADAAVERAPQIVSRPVFQGYGEAILTADLVLRSLNDIPNQRGSVPEGFRPAMPQSTSFDSVPPAVAP